MKSSGTKKPYSLAEPRPHLHQDNNDGVKEDEELLTDDDGVPDVKKGPVVKKVPVIKKGPIDCERRDNSPVQILVPTSSVPQHKTQSFLWLYIFLSIAIPVGAGLIVYKVQSPIVVCDFNHSIQLIHNDFPTQSSIWTEFHSGIRRVDFMEPAMFLLVGHSDKTAECLARRVGQAAQCYLNATQPTSQPLTVDGADINDEQYSGGRFITHYRPLVEEHGIFIITHLDVIPHSIAQSLHSFCDTVSPLVPQAVYIFTIHTSEPWSENTSVVKTAERVLHAAWDKLDKEIRTALIVRVTSGMVIDIRSETKLTNC